MIAMSKNLTKFQEDVSVLAVGTELLGAPARVYSITASCESTGVGIVNFSNSIDTYDVANRTSKIVLNGATTVPLLYPFGKTLTSGLCATANKASIDIEVVYEG